MASMTYVIGSAERTFAEAPTHTLLDALVELADVREAYREQGREGEWRRAEFLSRMVRAELRSRNCADPELIARN